MTVVSVSQEVRAPATRVWAMVADITRMHEWSPENSGATWLGGASGPVLGAKFRGTNKRGVRRWWTVGRITACEPGIEFAFDVRGVGLPVARWRYAFEPTSSESCRVTETFIDQRGWANRMLGRLVSGVKDRGEHNRSGMEETLRRLAAAAGPASSTPG